jgi:putative acyl-CoA dehydrogenase
VAGPRIRPSRSRAPSDAVRSADMAVSVHDPGRAADAGRGPGDPTHRVRNQPPPLEGYNALDADLALREALEREGGRGDSTAPATSAGCAPRPRRSTTRGVRSATPRASSPTTARAPRRQVDLDPVVALAPAPRGRTRAALAALARASPRRSCGPRRALHPPRRRQRRRHVPGLDDLRGGARLRRSPGRRRRVGAASPPPRLRDGGPGGDGDDRESRAAPTCGRTRRAPTDRRETVRARGHKWFCSHPTGTCFLVLAQAPPGSPASSSSAVPASRSSASRTSSAPARSRPRRSSSAASPAGSSVRRAAASPTIIEMVNHTRWTACSGRRRGCGGPWRRRCTTPVIARPSAPASPSSPR